MTFLKSVTDQLNLRWAWEKVRRASIPGDAWIDEIALAGFELELETNLQSIAAEMNEGRYKLQPLRPVGFPKNPSKDDKPQVRQYFNVAIRDQVAWTAVVNIIGPYLDPHMPVWSYGNRLFRSIWIDTDNDGIHRRKIGRYRDSSGQIYLPFRQSWPIFRRHVYLATYAMTAKGGKTTEGQMAKEDLDELRMQEQLTAENQCPFVLKKYWEKRQPDRGKKDLFWCSIDLEKFYPKLKLDVIHRNVIEFLPLEFRDEADNLIKSMMLFNLDTVNWKNEDLKKIDIRAKQRTFKGIPTGLYVAGFLANVGLLKVDLEVNEHLKNRDIAHFRFVDDHIVLAYSFDELVKWIDEYLKLLDDSGAGVKVNWDKIEPKSLAAYFVSRRKSKKSQCEDWKRAEKKCKLNPQFPTPLMTKTLGLVSAIARTDFDLLEESELVSLSDQLEHMLLVELPEAEIPEKTRLSFAATRLIRLAECRLSNDARLVELACRRQELDEEFKNGIEPNRNETWEVDSDQNRKSLEEQRNKLFREVFRAFGLIRKVLQERPDRVRLWTRAIKMCRQTGVKGLNDIFCDIERVKRDNPISAEYLLANTLSLLGYETIIAALIVSNPEIAEWRRKAAMSFLDDIAETCQSQVVFTGARWFLQKSREQFCFGLFCADVILRLSSTEENGYKSGFPVEVIKAGSNCLTNDGCIGSSQDMAWWAAKLSMRELSSQAPQWVIEIGRQIPSLRESYSFWRFFPINVPTDILLAMIADKKYLQDLAQMGGWWYDALSAKREIVPALLTKDSSTEIACTLNNLQSTTTSSSMSLHEWCAGVQQIKEKDASDPRASEWTALEIVRQVGESITKSNEFNHEYIEKLRANKKSTLCLHPANFRLPCKWITLRKRPTWKEWEGLIQCKGNNAQVNKVTDDLLLTDSRYTPMLSSENDLFVWINPVRGLGLLLYGLLRHNFDFPTVWNGPGHADVLGLLPPRLLKEMTCSSLTLGLLLGCLQPRAMENLKPYLSEYLHDDSNHDPVKLRTANEVCQCIVQCQMFLKQNQLSTINHRARQLTPISIRDLSKPDWSKAFKDVQEAGTGEQ